ncbi:DUF4097 family beta strand repeat-containing protein [Clostridioides difficile]
MKRKYEIITVVLVVILVIGALIFAGRRGTLKRENWNVSKNDRNEEVTKEFIPADGAVKFNLDIPNTSLEVISTEESSVKIECVANGEGRYYISQSGNNVTIEKDEKFSIFNWNNKTGKVKILIPNGVISAYYGDLSNGKINIFNIDTEEIDIDTSNGDIKIENLNVNNNIEIETSNASINVNVLVAKNINFDSSNGEVILEKVNGNEIKVDTSNGKISVSECRGNEIELDTANSEIMAYECYGNEVVLDSSNGDITLENIKDKDFIIDELEVSTSNAEENINANYNHKK